MENQIAPSENPLLALPPNDLAALIASLPLWQRRYLTALQSGLTPQQAAKAANCTTASIGYWTRLGSPRYSQQFARAVQAVEGGWAVMDKRANRDLAEAASGGLVLDAVQESRDRTVRDQARVNNRRLVLETAGMVGQPAALSVTVVNQVAEERWRLYQEVIVSGSSKPQQKKDTT